MNIKWLELNIFSSTNKNHALKKSKRDNFGGQRLKVKDKCIQYLLRNFKAGGVVAIDTLNLQAILWSNAITIKSRCCTTPSVRLCRTVRSGAYYVGLEKIIRFSDTQKHSFCSMSIINIRVFVVILY